jgi:ubiquinol-cytochrome c reductase cytochrome c subunit
MSMRSLVLAAVVVCLTLPGLSGASSPDAGIVHAQVPPGTSRLEHGLQLYAGNCASCHGSNGVGVTKRRTVEGSSSLQELGPSLRGVGALAADFYLRTGYMPLHQVGQQPRRSRVLFSERELDALIVYVASLGKGPPVPTPHPERGNLSEGLRLFTEHCAGCHQVAAEGGYVTGAVAPPLENATPVQIAEAVRIGPYVMPQFSKQVITDGQLDSIIAYVQKAKHPEDRGGWSLGHLGPVPEGMVAWLLAGSVLVATCLVIGRRLHGD